MTNEEKQLLLKDLCGRIPYGVICHYNCVIPIEGRELHKANCKDALRGIVPTPDKHIGFMVGFDKVNALEGDIKPYLRPMSSMTSKEWMEYCDACFEDNTSWTLASAGKEYKFFPITHREEFLNAHHFDHRGLIPMGLALEAPEGMYKTE